MTHSQNRTGISHDSDNNEIVVLCMVHFKQKAEKAEAIKKMTDIVLSYSPDNIIGRPLGIKDEDIRELSPSFGIITAVFNDKETVVKLLSEIRENNLGISVVLSSLFANVREICHRQNLTEHTFNISLGVFGQTEKLPDDDTLSITTQCGHALVAPALVRKIIRQVKKGDLTSDDGAVLLAKPCVCGIVNHTRTKRIIEHMAGG